MDMKTTTSGFVHQLTFLPGLFPVNCYLVEEADSLTLVDAALPYSAKGILAAAKRIGKRIERIVLTHPHEDHVGALDALKRALPEAPIYVSERDSRFFDRDLTLLPGEAASPIRGGVPKKLAARPDRHLQEGDAIGSLTAHASPGHTPGSLAFLDERDGTLIAGDAFQTWGRTAVAGTIVPWFPFPAFGTWDAPTAVNSARKLLELTPRTLAVGHGAMLRDPGEAMRLAIREAEARLGEGR
jgi:glyoxylase-like metal-dependent hydrolase (beta-lactamase superfamily II)